MTEYLEADHLVAVAQVVIGPNVVVGDPGLLASAAARPQTTVFGKDAYPGLFRKAAALLHSLTSNHALVDGNKRLAWAGTAVFLEINGWDLAAPSVSEGYDFVMGVAKGDISSLNEIEFILRRWSSPL